MSYLKNFYTILFILSFLFLKSCSWFGDDKSEIPTNPRIAVILQEFPNQNSNKEIIQIDNDIDLSFENSVENWTLLNLNSLNNTGNISINSLNLSILAQHNINHVYKISENIPNLIVYDNILYYINGNQEVIGIDYLNSNSKTNKIFKVDLSKYLISPTGLSLANNNTLIVTTANGILIAISTSSGQIEWTLNLINPITSVSLNDENSSYVISNDTLYSVDLYSGRINWKTIISKPSLGFKSLSTPTLYDNYLISGFSSGDIAILRKENGQPIWKSNIISNNLTKTRLISTAITASPLISNNKLLVTSYGNITSLYNLLSPNDKIWEKSIGSTETPIFQGNRVYIIDTNNFLNSLNSKNGETIFSFNLNFLLTDEEKKQEKKQEFITNFYGPILVNSNLLITSSKGNLYFISPKDGTLISKFSIQLQKKEFIFQRPIIVNNNIILLSNFGIIYVLQSQS